MGSVNSVDGGGTSFSPGFGRKDGQYVDVVFDGPPGPESGRFVEVEDSKGASVNFGEWVLRDDGFWVLRINYNATPAHVVQDLVDDGPGLEQPAAEEGGSAGEAEAPRRGAGGAP